MSRPPPLKETFYTAALYETTVVIFCLKKLTFLDVTKTALVSGKSFEIPMSLLNTTDSSVTIYPVL